MPARDNLDRKFFTLFDGDEINGKRYPLGGGVTKLDAFTAAYLLQTGRIEETDDDGFAAAEAPYADDETAADRDGTKTDDKDIDPALEAARQRFESGNIPADLINADADDGAPDKLVTKAKLAELAEAEGVEVKGNKVDIATAIMAKRGE